MPAISGTVLAGMVLGTALDIGIRGLVNRKLNRPGKFAQGQRVMAKGQIGTILQWEVRGRKYLIDFDKGGRDWVKEKDLRNAARRK